MDKIKLQRLFDGELDHEQRRDVLEQLDKQPSSWRLVALSLLEEQAFRREFSSLPLSQAAPPVAQSTSSATADSQFLKSAASNGTIYRWLPMALAASLLIGVGFAGGNWLASRFDSSLPADLNNVGSSIASAEPTNIDQTKPDVASLKPVGQLKFASDVSPNASGDVIQVPMYEAAPEQFNQMLMTQLQQIQQWNDQLRRRGYELDWQPEMIESRLPDGRAVIVPTQHVRVRNIGQ